MARFESVSVLTSTGSTVSRETRLMPRVIKAMSMRLTVKFQVRFLSAVRSSVVSAIAVNCQLSCEPGAGHRASRGSKYSKYRSTIVPGMSGGM